MKENRLGRKGQRLPFKRFLLVHYVRWLEAVGFLFCALLMAVIAGSAFYKIDDVMKFQASTVALASEPVKLPAYSTFESLPVAVGADDAKDAADSEEDIFKGYQSINILQPEADGVVRSNEGKVPVAIKLEPGLQRGHRVALYIDGKAVEDGFDGLAIELSGVERGTHSIQAAVSDEKGKQLIKSASVSFTLRQTGLFDNAGKQPRPPTIQPVPRPRPGGG